MIATSILLRQFVLSNVMFCFHAKTLAKSIVVMTRNSQSQRTNRPLVVFDEKYNVSTDYHVALMPGRA